MSSVKVMQLCRNPLSKVRWPEVVQRIEMDTKPPRTKIVDNGPRALPVNTGPNRHERRAGEAKARQNRKLFARYKAHMAQHGYDATFDDFVKSIP